MIQKIISIKNVGRFTDCRAAGDVTFGKCNLIFGENGRGKTTLCAILRSLQSDDPSLVIGRKTLGSVTGDPEVNFRLDTDNAAFTNGAWSRTVPELVIFDNSFIAQNVYAGESVDVDHRKNLYHVIVGRQGVTLAQQINQLDADIRDKNAALADARAGVQGQIPEGAMPFDDFIALPADANIDALIADKERDLSAVMQAARIQQSPELKTVVLPELPADLLPLLEKTVEGIAADAERRITAHLQAHSMEDQGRTWLSHGYEHIKDNKCPFCGQDLSASALISAYQGFFSDAYNDLKTEIRSLGNIVSSDFGDRELAKLETTLHDNETSAAFWTQFCTITAPTLPAADALISALSRLRENIMDHLSRKAQAPLERMTPNSQIQEDFEIYRRFHTDITAYNRTLAEANTIIRARKQQTQASAAGAVEAELLRLKTIKKRYEPSVAAHCQIWQTLVGEKQALETQKTTTRTALDTYTSTVISNYERSINTYLDCFNAGFRLAGTNHDYRGGTPSARYQIEINQTPVDLGNASSPNDTPSFRNTLSAGDRSALALAFFLAQLEHDPDKAQKIIVFDDPFTSQDDFRRMHTAQRIILCAQDCAQVIVLSHDKNFLKLVWDDLPAADRKTLHLFRIGAENTNIGEWDIEVAVQARYKAELAVLSNYYNLGHGDPRDVVQKIRPVLEAFCRNLFPSKFPDSDTLGVIVGKIQQEGPSFMLAPICQRLDELNRYTRRYHHAENPNAAQEAISNTELKGYVETTLNIVGCL